MVRAYSCGFFFLLAALCIAARTVWMKQASYFAEPYEAVLVINGVALCLLFPLTLRHGFKSLISSRFGSQFFRGLTNMGVMLLAFYLLHSLPTLPVTLMLNWGPLFVPLLALFYYNKRLDGLGFFYQVLGWIGVVLACLSPLHHMSFYLLFGVLMGFFGGATLLTNESLARTPATTTLFYGHLTGAIILLPGLVWAWKPLSLPQWGILALIAFLTLAIEGLVALAIHIYEESRYFMPLLFCALIVSGVADYFIWRFIPNVLLLLGLVLSTVSASLIQERRHRYGGGDATR